MPYNNIAMHKRTNEQKTLIKNCSLLHPFNTVVSYMIHACFQATVEPTIQYLILDGFELDFSIFANDNNMLRNFYRCYNNPMDKIHLGSKGLRELESMILKRTSLLDTRSYSSVV